MKWLAIYTPLPYISIEQVPTDAPSTSSKSQQSTLQFATTEMSQDVSQHQQYIVSIM